MHGKSTIFYVNQLCSGKLVELIFALLLLDCLIVQYCMYYRLCNDLNLVLLHINVKA